MARPRLRLTGWRIDRPLTVNVEGGVRPGPKDAGIRRDGCVDGRCQGICMHPLYKLHLRRHGACPCLWRFRFRRPSESTQWRPVIYAYSAFVSRSGVISSKSDMSCIQSTLAYNTLCCAGIIGIIMRHVNFSAALVACEKGSIGLSMQITSQLHLMCISYAFPSSRCTLPAAGARL